MLNYVKVMWTYVNSVYVSHYMIPISAHCWLPKQLAEWNIQESRYLYLFCFLKIYLLVFLCTRMTKAEKRIDFTMNIKIISGVREWPKFTSYFFTNYYWWANFWRWFDFVIIFGIPLSASVQGYIQACRVAQISQLFFYKLSMVAQLRGTVQLCGYLQHISFCVCAGLHTGMQGGPNFPVILSQIIYGGPTSREGPPSISLSVSVQDSIQASRVAQIFQLFFHKLLMVAQLLGRVQLCGYLRHISFCVCAGFHSGVQGGTCYVA